MNILMINGTMRKSSTYTAGRRLIEKISGNGDEVKELFLPREMPEFCRGCGACIWWDEKKCPDYLIYMRRITEMTDWADLLVFTTPVFAYHATGQMKALLDHYSYRWMAHRPEESMFSKQAVVVSTAAKAGMKKAARDITDSLRYWGIARIYTYGIAIERSSWPEITQSKKEKIDRGLEKLAGKIKRPEKVKPALKTKLLFLAMRYMHKYIFQNPVDKSYWEDKGWLGSKRPWK